MTTGIYRKDAFTADETNIYLKYLTNAGSKEQNVNGSVTAIDFTTDIIPDGKILLATRLLLYMEDSSAFASDLFGGIAALTNGWELVLNGTVIANIKDNHTMATLMFDLTGDAIFGKVNQTMVGRFTFSKFTDGAMGITVRSGETFTARVNDDLTGLDYLNIMVQGVIKDA